MDFKLEVIARPASDVDRDLAFCQGHGWRRDVQLIPPGSPASVLQEITTRLPGR